MGAFAETFYLLPYLLILFWLGFAISKFIKKVELSVKDILIAFALSWFLASVPQLIFGKALYNSLNESFFVIGGSLIATLIMRNIAENRKQDAYVDFVSPNGHEIRRVKIGFSWPCFLFAFFFGLPLFLRKLNVWGGLMAGICFFICSLEYFGFW